MHAIVVGWFVYHLAVGTSWCQQLTRLTREAVRPYVAQTGYPATMSSVHVHWDRLTVAAFVACVCVPAVFFMGEGSLEKALLDPHEHAHGGHTLHVAYDDRGTSGKAGNRRSNSHDGHIHSHDGDGHHGHYGVRVGDNPSRHANSAVALAVAAEAQARSTPHPAPAPATGGHVDLDHGADRSATLLAIREATRLAAQKRERCLAARSGKPHVAGVAGAACCCCTKEGLATTELVPGLTATSCSNPVVHHTGPVANLKV